MTGRTMRLIAATLLACFMTNAEAVVIKLATIAPKDSTWHRQLQEMGARWAEVSDGEVQLKIYAGTLGDEPDIMRKVRIGALDGALVTMNSLGTIHPVTESFNIPLAFASHAELDYVRDGLAPVMEDALADKGFIVLHWTEAGWVHFFTKTPVRTPDDLRQHKLFVWAGTSSTTEAEELWRQLGFQPVPLTSIDILPAQQTGMITALPTPPLAALANQWFPLSPYMTDLKWAAVLGATIITARSWEKIPPEHRPAIAKIAREVGIGLTADVRQLEQDAMDAMLKRGLEVVAVSDETFIEWQTTVESVYPQIRGNMIDEEYFDEVIRLRDQYRAQVRAN